MTRRAVVVRPAQPADFPAIVRLIHDYFRVMGRVPQYRDHGEWYVAEIEGEVVAAWTYLGDRSATERWVLDCYADDDWRGRLGLAALADRAHREADAAGTVLLGHTELSNPRQHYAMSRRGWQPVGMLWRRAPQGVR